MRTHYVPYRKPTHTAWVSLCGRWRPERAVFGKPSATVTCTRCLRSMAKRKMIVSTVTMTVTSTTGKRPDILAVRGAGKAGAVALLTPGMSAVFTVTHRQGAR